MGLKIVRVLNQNLEYFFLLWLRGFNFFRFTHPYSLDLVEPFSTILCSMVDRQQVPPGRIHGISLV